MMKQNSSSMRAIVLNKFGGPEELVWQNISVPKIGPEEILMRVEYAGVGVWDVFEREGGYADLLGMEAKFPYVLGSEGAGTIASVGDKVEGFKPGDKVYAPGFLNPKGGFYAEYVALDWRMVACIPEQITTKEAAAVSGVGITALRGLVDVLKLKRGESVLIFGASGGVGHIAVQIAKKLGAKVFAVASGEDGVAMIKNFGSEAVIDGREETTAKAANLFAPRGFDAALFTAGGELAAQAVHLVRPGGRIAYPYGVFPEPQAPPEVMLTGYYGDPDPDIFCRLNELIKTGLGVHVAQTYLLENAREAHEALNAHYLGKFVLKVNH